MTSSKSSHASLSEQDFETDTDEDENEDPGPSCRRNVLELDSDEESELFRLRRTQKRQRQVTPSSSSCSHSDDEQFYCRVQAQSAARRRKRREIESPIRIQDYSQDFVPEHPARVDLSYAHDDISVSGETVSSLNESGSDTTSISDDNRMLEGAYDVLSEEGMSEYNEDNADEDSCIFENSSVSVKTFNHLFLGVAEKHSISGKAQSDLLDLFNISLPEVNNIPKSIYLFNKGMSHLNYTMTNYAVCSSCKEEIICINNPVCVNDDCQNFHQKVEPLEFAIIDILPQLQRVFAGNWPTIKENLHQITYGHVPGVYKDITDGHIYRIDVPQNPDENNVVVTSLAWHVDGSAAVKSKDLKLWPIFAVIIEVPKAIRYSFYNVMFCELWHGKQKPDFVLFQERFVEQINMLMTGFTIDLPDHNIACRLRIQGQLADLPAKAASVNFKQFNGKFGCSVCLDPGVADEANPLLRYYPYRTQKPPLRNHDDSIQHANLANNGKDAVFGIKGPSPIHSILTLPEKLLLDYLHQVLEGEYYRKLKCWFVKSKVQDLFCLKNVVTEFDKLTLNVKLPHDFPKKMRTIRDLGKWKAHEKEIMLLHVGLPILRKFLPSEHFYHHALFVTGIKILTDDTILEQDRQLAEALLDSYIRMTENLYHYSDYTYNLHSLGHLAQQVLNHGNLILLSTFVFEGMIALLKRKFYGTRGIVPQILKNVGRSQNAKHEISKCVNQSDNAKSFCDQLFAKSAKKNKITENIFFFAPLKSEIPSGLQYVDLTEFGLDATTDNLTFAYRMEKNGECFHSEAYPQKRTSCSYFVSFKVAFNEESYGIIKCFVVKNNVPYAVVREFMKLNQNVCQTGELPDPDDAVALTFVQSGLLGCHFQAVQETERLCKVLCDDILSRVIFVPLEDTDIRVSGYVSKVLKSYQHD